MKRPKDVVMHLGKLADPNEYQDPIAIDGCDHSLLVEQLSMMLLIRRVEEKLADMVLQNKVVCPCHLGVGQEAVAVGVSANLRRTDSIFGNHRSHSHFLALGGSVESLFAEVLGKETGCSRGMGGSMHLFDESVGFKGSVPIVAATVPMAVGAALASSMDRKSNLDMGVAFFGDGAIEEGVVHESMNFAGNFNLPMLFVVENNMFSSHLHIDLRQPADSVARYAVANALNHKVVDGNDVVAVANAAGELIEMARESQGAGFLEAVTYRWRGHVGPSEDNDVGLKRTGDLKRWKRRDPIGRLKKSLIEAGSFSEREYTDMDDGTSALIEAAWQAAEDAPYPPPEDLLKNVWASTGDSAQDV